MTPQCCLNNDTGCFDARCTCTCPACTAVQANRLTVYVLFHETNTGSAAGDSDGYVEGIYWTKEAAEAAKLDAIKDAKAEGETVYFDPDDPEAEGDPNWTADWRIEEHQIYGDRP